MRLEPRLPELVHIPAGEFLMGDDFGPRSAQPAHEIVLPDYWISRYPLTVLEYAAYMIAQKRAIPGFWPDAVRWIEDAGKPVAAISWRDAMGYCAWLAEQARRRVRLPTEAEWEKAATWDASHQAKAIYPWGNEFDPACANTAESLIGETTLVDTYRIIGDSRYGVTDMLGNVTEWTLARYLPYPYTDTEGRHDPNLMGYRTVRGGSFQSEGRWTSAVHRQYLSPEENRYPVGFRIVIEAK
jgi:formylglycine-generating enzyme required for sulfatase activity